MRDRAPDTPVRYVNLIHATTFPIYSEREARKDAEDIPRIRDERNQFSAPMMTTLQTTSTAFLTFSSSL